MHWPTGAPSTAVPRKIATRTHSPNDIKWIPPCGSDVSSPAGTNESDQRPGGSNHNHDDEQAEARVDEVEAQPQHRSVLAPEEKNVVDNAWEPPKKKAADDDQPDHRGRAASTFRQ